MIKCKINCKLNAKRIVANILLILAIFTLFRLLAVYELGKEEVKTYDIIIDDNDTLWNIASKISSEKELNIQKVIYDIQDINNMNSSNIYKGQTLLIPIYN